MATIEFALVMPMLVSVLFAVFDLTNAVITWRRLTIAAQSIAEIATEAAVQPDGSNLLTPAQAWQSSTAAFAIFPSWKTVASGTPSFAVTLSGAVLTPTVAGCVSACTYVANTAWSLGLKPGNIQLRPCGVLAQVANTAPETLANLPVGVVGPAPLVIADVATVFTPTFFTVFTGPVSMLRSAYLPPRTGSPAQYVHLSTAASSGVTGGSCQGY